MFEDVKQKLIDNTNFVFEDKPIYFENFIKNPEVLATWNDIEDVINNPAFYETELISNETGVKEGVPASPKLWLDGKIIKNKKFIFDRVKQGSTLIVLNYGFRNKITSEFLSVFETLFDTNAAAHIYCGLESSKSFCIHADHPANFIVQLDGESHWKVFDNRVSSLIRDYGFKPHLKDTDLRIAIDVVMKPGDCLYIPAKHYHAAIPLGKRISMSIACWPDNADVDTLRYDRNYYTL
jgi:hypothetical protein